MEKGLRSILDRPLARATVVEQKRWIYDLINESQAALLEIF
jgi:hypothetical protein